MEDGGGIRGARVDATRTTKCDDDQKTLRVVLFIMMWPVREHRSLRHVQNKRERRPAGNIRYTYSTATTEMTRRLPFRGAHHGSCSSAHLHVCSSAHHGLKAEWLNGWVVPRPPLLPLRHSWSLSHLSRALSLSLSVRVGVSVSAPLLLTTVLCPRTHTHHHSHSIIMVFLSLQILIHG